MLELTYRERGFRYIFGIDEAGRGPMAGPLVAATVCLPLGDFESLQEKLKGVKDSKEMTFRQRERAFELIREVALTWGIGEVSAHEISLIGNMTLVTIKAMQRALDNAFNDEITRPDILLVDYLHLPDYDDVPQESLTRGENQSLSIASASVLAKVYRDRKMIKFAEKYPDYGFERHKGYITAAHKSALYEYGPCEIHRTNYAPVQLAKQSSLFD
jgi:ribonuclease HII